MVACNECSLISESLYTVLLRCVSVDCFLSVRLWPSKAIYTNADKNSRLTYKKNRDLSVVNAYPEYVSKIKNDLFET
jgi:hypothetical protein